MKRDANPMLAFVIYQAAWFACVFLARDGHPWLGAFAMLLFVFAHFAADWEKRSGDIATVLICGIYGFGTDSLLATTGLLSFTQLTLPVGPSPFWMVALWLGFGTALNTSMSWLHRNTIASAVIGAVIGPVAYGGGVSLDLIVMGPDPAWTYAALAVQWAIALVLLPAVAAASQPMRWNGAIVARRVVTVSQFTLMWLLCVGLSPLIFTITLSVDLSRRIARGVPITATRFFLTFLAYLSAELIGLVFLLAVWIRARGDAARLLEISIPIQVGFAGGLFFTLCRIFGLTLSVEGDEECTTGPMIIFIRHCSMLDTLMPTAILTVPYGITINFVLKKELLRDPCIDVAGNRLRNHFVDRSKGNREDEARAIAELAENLKDNEAAMIFPEGTRFTPARRERALERLKESRPELYERASRLKHVLPIRPAGCLALLDKPADVVFLGHKGFDNLTTWAELWNGDLVGKTIDIRMWRIPRAEIPESPEERIDWLFSQWEILDGWLEDLSIRDEDRA